MKKLKSLLSMVTDEAAVHHQKLTVIIITRVRSCFTETFKCPWPKKKKNNWLLLNKNSFLWKILQQKKKPVVIGYTRSIQLFSTFLTKDFVESMPSLYAHKAPIWKIVCISYKKKEKR